MVTPPYSPAFFFSGIPVPPRFAKVFHDVVAPIDMSNDRRFPWSLEPRGTKPYSVLGSQSLEKKKLTDSQEALRRGRKRRIIF